MSTDVALDIDDVLLAQARAGDRPTGAELLKRHAASVLAKLDINAKWRSVLEAEDVLQVTCIEALLDLDRFRGKAVDFPRWLHTIAQNNLRDAIEALGRAKRPHPDKNVFDGDEMDTLSLLYRQATGSVTTPSARTGRDDMRRLLEAEIARLPDDYAETLRLLYIHGLTIPAVADRLQRKPGAIYMLHARALERLRERLGTKSRFLSDSA